MALIALVFANTFCVAANCRSQVQLDEAIERATRLLEKGVVSYPEHRSCFSCHHQALPLLAFSIGRLEQGGREFYEESLTKSVLHFTDRAFAAKVDTLNEGGEVGGRALTVAYGLWALDLAGAPANKTTAAMVEYLLKVQLEEGAWNFQSTRPPAASSKLMTTAVSVYGLRSYGYDSAEAKRVRQAFFRANQWSRQQNAQSHEDLIGQIWLEQMTEAELNAPGERNDAGEPTIKNGAISDVEPREDSSTPATQSRSSQLISQLLKSQRDDGGWAQELDMLCDAYATGQAIVMLSQVRNQNGDMTAALRRAVDFLLDNQETDGSWHIVSHAKPVQVFFDNGDPHGKDQFISVMGTSWATAALREYRYRTGHPLDSVRVLDRLRLSSKH